MLQEDKTLAAPDTASTSIASWFPRWDTDCYDIPSPATVDVNTNYSALLGIKSPELYDLLCTLNKILRKTLMIYIKAKSN